MQVCCKSHLHSYCNINLPVHWHWGQPGRGCQVPSPLVLRCYIILQAVDAVPFEFYASPLIRRTYVSHQWLWSSNVWQTQTGLVSWEILDKKLHKLYIHFDKCSPFMLKRRFERNMCRDADPEQHAVFQKQMALAFQVLRDGICHGKKSFLARKPVHSLHIQCSSDMYGMRMSRNARYQPKISWIQTIVKCEILNVWNISWDDNSDSFGYSLIHVTTAELM